jgi:osmotically-inducible protein OsmY
MKVRYFVGAIAIAGVGFAPPAALAQATQTPGTTQKVDDGALKSRIESRIKSSASLKDSDIDVDVDHGVVTLTGTVHSEAESVRARSLAKVAGVTKVENKLTVDSTTARTMEKTADKTERAGAKVADETGKAAEKTADKTGKAAEKTADKTGSTAQKAGKKAEKVLEKGGIRIEDDKTATTGTAGKRTTAEGKDDVIDVDAKINDAWITTKVKTNFVNEDVLKGSDINVDSHNHVVTLKGTVPSAAARARAVQLAKSTKGVTRVNDQLTIAPPK